MWLFDWLNLNKRVKKLEGAIEKLHQENIALISAPFIDTFVEGEVIRGSEIEEASYNEESETVEEREYHEEQRYLNQRKQKDRLS